MAGVTMTMVAREAGVSVSTVSHVINGTRPVNPDTRRLVVAAMEKLGFSHRPVAGSLAAGSTITIGLAISVMFNPAMYELVVGIEEEALRRQARIVLVETREDPVHEERAVAGLLAHHIDGLLISPSAGWENHTLRLLRERPLPFVVIDRLQDLRFDQVGVENEAASQSVTDHLLGKGHRRVAVLAGQPGTSTSRERVLGFQQAHTRRGLALDPALVIDTCDTFDAARRAMTALLALADPPTAVFTTAGAITVGALRAIRAAGLRVPDDIAMVCFDEVPWSGVAEPSMTVVAQPAFAIGARAVQLILRRMADPALPHQTLRLAGEIVHRHSCGCDPSPAHRDAD